MADEKIPVAPIAKPDPEIKGPNGKFGETKNKDEKKKNKKNRWSFRKFIIAFVSIIGVEFIGYKMIVHNYTKDIVWVLLTVFATASVFIGGDVAEKYVEIIGMIFTKGKKDEKNAGKQ